jgi:trimeric autotransporter adhesin
MGSSVVVAAMGFVLSADAALGQIVSVSLLVCNPNSLNSGSTTTCTVILSGTAPAGGTVVLLSSNNTLLPVPGTWVMVPAGAFATTFTATAGIISSNQSATFTAIALNSVLLTWTASVSPDVTNYNVYRAISSGGPYSMVTTLGVVTRYTDYTVQNGQIYYYVVTAVNNSGEESAYSNQASVAVPAEVAQTATVSLVAPAAPVILSSLACKPSSLNSGAATTCTVTLSNFAPSGGTVVSLSSSNTLLPVPAASITVPAGTTSTTFTATAGTIARNQSATLTATLSGVSQTATVSLVAPRRPRPRPPFHPPPERF